MKVLGLDRVVIATGDIDETAGQFADLLGLDFSDPIRPTTDTERGAQSLGMVISAAGVELITPNEGETNDGENNEVARFIEENGPGLYALSIRVPDLERAKAELSEKGVEPVGEFESNEFKESFFHPAEFGGAFVILAEYDTPHDAATAMTSGST